MRRRAFLAGIASVVAAPLVGEGQPARIPRVGVLTPVTPSAASPYVEVAREAFRELGYVEGQNLILELRFAERDELLPERAAALVRQGVDVIMTTGTPATLAAKRATTTIPIVMTAVNDPVADGLVASLAKPGGNVTGNAVLQPELTAKQLELLKEVAPSASRIAMLAHDDAPGLAVLWKASEERAARLGLKLERVDVRRSADFDVAFGAIVRSRVDALLAVADPLVYLHIARIADFALKQRLPTIAFFSEFVPAGGLLAYGPSLSSLTRRATLYVDKILKGARPGDLPVEQPTKFELAINLKTAKALGITVPQSLLLRADQVVQ
ncbi:MAG: hypothetical protein AUH30_06975 [Candidatus Rokubacteria bacterium 13_1_40CM_68_15]|nr:MAG: hypothetical protein AUH30_06975 [Candidatus Rokubacteria bacterium 13_1_40CM_68_15]